MSNKKNTIFLLVIILFIGIFYILTIREGHYWGGDFSQYIHHAKNIVEGKPYSDIGYIQNLHYPEFLGPTTYPPVFPIILSPVYSFFGLNSSAMKIELILFFLFALYLIYRLFYKKISSIPTLVLIVILALNPYFWNYKDYLHLDFIFIFFIYLSLNLIHKIYNLHSPLNIKKFYPIVLGVTIYLATGIKGLGMTLMVSLLLHDLIRSKKINTNTLITFFTFLLLLSIQYLFIHNDFEYLNNFTLNPFLVFPNLVSYIKANLQLWENSWISFPRNLLAILFYIILIIGYYSRVRDNISILEIFVPIFYFSLIIYQYYYSQFLMAILPILFYYVFSGFSYIFDRYAITYKKYIVAGLLFVVFSGYAMNYVAQDYGPVNEGVETRNAKLLFEEIKKNSNENDVYVFWKPRVLSLYANRKASIYHQASDSDLLEYLNTIKSKFLITGPISNSLLYRRPYDVEFIKFLEDFIVRNSSNFNLIYKNDEFKIFRYHTE